MKKRKKRKPSKSQSVFLEVKTQNYMTVRTGHINFDFHGIKVIVKIIWVGRMWLHPFI